MVFLIDIFDSIATWNWEQIAVAFLGLLGLIIPSMVASYYTNKNLMRQSIESGANPH